MLEKKVRKPRGNPTVRFRLPAKSRDQLHKLAARRTGGDVSALIRDMINRETGTAELTLTAEEFWPIVALVAAILDEARVERRSNDDYICAIRDIYGLLLERCVLITGVDQ